MTLTVKLAGTDEGLETYTLKRGSEGKFSSVSKPVSGGF